MKWSKYFIPTLKETPTGTEAVSHQLSLRAGLVHMLTSGVYSYLPLGLRVLKRIEDIIREEMNAVG
ncbi:MAG: proline--tRNA ligase, partial [Candidatus Omnitrophica bacterium]|nr:proline--tRNA ligase [Candidatus Omnitrophota bacterium]